MDINGFVWFVDNTNAGIEDGSQTNPFDTLFEAQTSSADGDLIFVFEGDGTTTGMNSGIALKNNQLLIGEGVGSGGMSAFLFHQREDPLSKT